MKTLIVLLLLALAGLVWLGRENSTLSRSFEKANHVADGQKRQNRNAEKSAQRGCQPGG